MSCPGCGQPNRCALQQPDAADGVTGASAGLNADNYSQTSLGGCGTVPGCWCFSITLTGAQQQLLPVSTSCYCEACLRLLTRSAEGS